LNPIVPSHTTLKAALTLPDEAHRVRTDGSIGKPESEELRALRQKLEALQKTLSVALPRNQDNAVNVRDSARQARKAALVQELKGNLGALRSSTASGGSGDGGGSGGGNTAVDSGVSSGHVDCKGCLQLQQRVAELELELEANAHTRIDGRVGSDEAQMPQHDHNGDGAVPSTAVDGNDGSVHPESPSAATSALSLASAAIFGSQPPLISEGRSGAVRRVGGRYDSVGGSEADEPDAMVTFGARCSFSPWILPC
jgi:hypothetical protein